jgi:hypothetical protein
LYLIFNCTYFLISAALVFRSSIALAVIKKLVISRSVRHLGGKRGDSPVLRGAESLLLLETSSGGHLGGKGGDSPVLRCRISPSSRNQFWRPSWRKERRQPSPRNQFWRHLGGKGGRQPCFQGGRTSPSPRNQFWRPSWRKERRQPCPQGCRESLLIQ